MRPASSFLFIQLSNSRDGIILAVEIGGTAYAQIERELEISRMQNVKVKGVIVVA